MVFDDDGLGDAGGFLQVRNQVARDMMHDVTEKRGLEVAVGRVDFAAVELLVFGPTWVIDQVRGERMNIDAAPVRARQAFADRFGEGHVAAANVEALELVVSGVGTVDRVRE